LWLVGGMGKEEMINNVDEYEHALKTLSTLIDEVEVYESAEFGGIGRGVDAVIKIMHKKNLRQKDLVDLFGSKGRVSEALNKKRPMSLKVMKKIKARFGISLDVLAG